MRDARSVAVALAALSGLFIGACTADPESDGDPEATTAGAPGPASSEAAAPATTVATPAERPSAVVGLSVLAPVPAIELTVSGFKDSVEDCDTVAIDLVERNARGDIPLLTSIAEEFLETDVDMIATFSTPAAQAAFKVVGAAGGTTPVVYSVVTDPFAAGLALDPGTHEPWITGSQSLPPIADVIDAAQAIVPDLAVIGVVYNPSEANSQGVTNTIAAIARERGLTLEVAPVAGADEVGAAADSLVELGVQAFVVPPDTTVVSGLAGLAQVADANDRLVIGTDANIAGSGAAIGLGTDYYGSGFRAGGIACRVLGGEATPADFDVINIESLGVAVNETASAAQGVTIPDDLRELAEIIE